MLNPAFYRPLILFYPSKLLGYILSVRSRLHRLNFSAEPAEP